MAENIFEILRGNPYPGRGIILGKNDGGDTYIVYFIMGRSENSRNRVFVPTEDGIKTQAHDPDKMTDPSLIIYHPVRFVGGRAIVTNGDQTENIAGTFKEGHGLRCALRPREFEPDGPNYTPRISGVVYENGSYELSILKSFHGDPNCCCRNFFTFDTPVAGFGHFISTYKGDGSPLPSFEGEPVTISVEGTITEFARRVWESLNPDNKVSLYACRVPSGGGEADRVIFNKNLGD
jgi:IMP cyclohydrolase